MEENNPYDPNYARVITKLVNVIILLILVIVVLFTLLFTGLPKKKKPILNDVLNKDINSKNNSSSENFWLAPDTNSWQNESEIKLIRYGRHLIVNTAAYFGPKGSILKISNGMNCQNCHLEAGTKIFGNNYSAVKSTYPKFRERSGQIESIEKRVNDCFERSLNGKAIESTSPEMKAIVAYINWIGKEVVKGQKPNGSGLKELPYLNRAASPENGQKIFQIKCVKCHVENGSGKMNSDGLSFQYPPLWGDNSYNQGAGLFRLSRFASYVKYNMPQGASFETPQLSDEEAWDVAAFVISQDRPKMNLSKDWPKISAKPIDHPFGPYADNFSEQQHKYGPFADIAAAKKLKNKN